MEWAKWCLVYPVREVFECPKESEAGPYSDREDAENDRDWHEITYERGGYEVVSYQGSFYLINKREVN